MKRWGLACGIGVVLSVATMHAHHSISGVYDDKRRAIVEGIVAQFRFVNPHPFLVIEVVDGSGNAQQWLLEMDNRGELAEIGVKNDTLKQGDRVVVTGSLSRTEPHQLYVRALERPADGFRYEQVGQSPKVRFPSR